MGFIIVGKNLNRVSPEQIEELAHSGRSFMVFDLDRCLGCHICEVSCKMANQIAPGVRVLQVRPLGWSGQDGEWRVLNIRFSCRQCEQPECVYACPAGALRKTEQGTVIQDEEVCVGCRICELVCPYAMISYDFELHLAKRCDFCLGTQGEDVVPVCVQHCLMGALVFEKGEGLRSFLKQKESEGAGFILW